MRPEKPEAKVAGRQLGRSLIVMALLLPVLPRNLRAVFFSHLMTISSAQGQGKGVSSCIRILSDKARHEVVIITKHEGARSSSWWERLKMEVVCTARGSQEVAHLDVELKRSVGRVLNLPRLRNREHLGARRGLERPTMRRCRMFGAADNPGPAGAPRPRGRNPGRRQNRLQLRECLLLGVRPEWNVFVRPGPDLRRLPEAADASLTSGTVRPDCS